MCSLLSYKVYKERNYVFFNFHVAWGPRKLPNILLSFKEAINKCMQKCILWFGHQKHNSYNNCKFILPGLCLVSWASSKLKIFHTSFHSQKNSRVDNNLYSVLTVAFAHSQIFLFDKKLKPIQISDHWNWTNNLSWVRDFPNILLLKNCKSLCKTLAK